MNRDWAFLILVQRVVPGKLVGLVVRTDEWMKQELFICMPLKKMALSPIIFLTYLYGSEMSFGPFNGLSSVFAN